ncbi:hypothetical protein VN97_g8961 [Penicillium thymicola]|uniref:Uncharacterized protein n=1 Tax=Penicillium thymicola TaxID=293382 RepID=A0AAI9TCJ4_PENTH|nr:hypothetical protein VN97_g8961 [Penicillium thymicola]
MSGDGVYRADRRFTTTTTTIRTLKNLEDYLYCMHIRDLYNYSHTHSSSNKERYQSTSCSFNKKTVRIWGLESFEPKETKIFTDKCAPRSASHYLNA